MPPVVHEGTRKAESRRFAIVASRWNESIAGKLVAGALEALAAAGAPEANIEIFRCPGAFEIPGLAGRVANTGRFAGIVCLGAVIRGDTPHFDIVVQQSASGCARIGAKAKVALGFGVLCCNNIEQALERAGAGSSNRGFDAANVMIEMASLYDHIDHGSRRPAARIPYTRK